MGPQQKDLMSMLGSLNISSLGGFLSRRVIHSASLGVEPRSWYFINSSPWVVPVCGYG